MAGREHRGRVYGPYDERPDGWRVVVVSAAGTRSSHLAATERAGHALRISLEAELEAEARTVSQALEEYRAHLVAKGNKARSRETTMDRVTGFFAGAPDRDPPIPDAREEFLVDIGTARCARLYDAVAARCAVDTHRNVLKETRTFFRWAKKRGLVGANPLLTEDGELAVEGIGRRNLGKLQLRIDEARRFRAVAVPLARAGDRGALAALLTLMMGMRSGEVLRLAARDLDDKGRLIWIAADDVDEGKTELARRALRVEPELAPLLRKVAKECAGGDVFPTRQNKWLWRAVRRICKQAGIPVVSSHGLRGTHSSIATEFGESSSAVAAQLGHTERVNKKHYTSRSAAAARTSGRVADRLGGTPKKKPKKTPRRRK